MNESGISRYITESLEGVDAVNDAGNSFFFYNPDKDVPPDHRFPFVTLVTNDLYDQFSNLARPSLCRLSIGCERYWKTGSSQHLGNTDRSLLS